MGNEAVALIGGEGVTEYFRELVEEALDHQRVDVDDPTAFYVVQMLSAFARRDAQRGDVFHSDTPLAVRFLKALEAGGAEQRQELQRIGDATLFLSGFFAASLRRSLVDVDYFMTLGGHAYGSLSRLTNPAVAPIFNELALHFAALVDVLDEVRERSALGRGDDVLRLYEMWLRTGSPRHQQRLRARGVLPVPGTTRIQ